MENPGRQTTHRKSAAKENTSGTPLGQATDRASISFELFLK